MRFIKKLSMAFIIIILTISMSFGILYFFCDRIVKFYQVEPLPLFPSDIIELDTQGYIFENPEERYNDYDLDSNTYDIRDFGALDRDFSTITNDIIISNTNAINQAIEMASLDNGIVIIPQGNYISGKIMLKSNLILRLKGNLIASRDKNHFAGQGSSIHFIYGKNIYNLIIEGDGGKIMGEGEYFWNNPLITPLESNLKVSDVRLLKFFHFQAKREKKSGRPSPFIKIEKSNNIVFRNIVLENSPGWTLTFESSSNILVKDAVLNNNIRGGNVDGIGIVGSSDVDIDNVLIRTADDGIVLKNPKLSNSTPMTNINVRNAKIMTTCNAFKIGTETYADISNVTFVDSEILSLDIYPGAISAIAIESVDGSNLSNIYVDNIIIDGVLAPLFIRLGNRNRYGGKDLMGGIDGVEIKNIVATDVQLPSIITGVKDSGKVLSATNISIDNFNVKYLESREMILFSKRVKEHPAVYPDVWMFGDVPAYGIYIRHAEVDLSNINITPRQANRRKEIVRDWLLVNIVSKYLLKSIDTYTYKWYNY